MGFSPPPFSSIPREETEEGLKNENERGESKKAFYMINARRLSIGFGGKKIKANTAPMFVKKLALWLSYRAEPKKFENSPMK